MILITLKVVSWFWIFVIGMKSMIGLKREAAFAILPFLFHWYTEQYKLFINYRLIYTSIKNKIILSYSSILI